jgi:Na+/proline symporter
MIVAAILVFLATRNAAVGGFAGMSATLLADDPASIGPWGSAGMLASLSWFFLFLLGVFGAATFAAALVPVVAIGFNWKRATARAANVAIGTSLVVNLVMELFGVRLPHGIHGGVVALIVSLLLFFGISLASQPPRLEPDIEAVLDG